MDSIIEALVRSGYLGVALLMFLENVFPPIPSEVIMPLAGVAARKGGLSCWGVIAAGTAGSLAGALFWYRVGLAVGRGRVRRWVERRGRWIALSSRDLDRAEDWFLRRGAASVFVGRLLPGVRTLISLPAGIYRMPLRKFFLYSAAGTLIWTSALAWAGWLLGANYGAIGSWTGWLGNAVLGAVLGWLLWRHIRRWRRGQL